MREKFDQVKGGFIGIAYGDAFGMPAEMWSRELIQKKLGKQEVQGPPTAQP